MCLFFFDVYLHKLNKKVMKQALGFNGEILQVFAIGVTTVNATFTNEPATGKTFMAGADLQLTVTFTDASAISFPVLAGQVFGFNDTVATITTTLAGLLS